MNSLKLSILALTALLLTAAVLLVTGLKNDSPAKTVVAHRNYTVWSQYTSTSVPFTVGSKDAPVFDGGVYEAYHLPKHHGFFVDFAVQCETGASVYLVVNLYTNQKDAYGRPAQINGAPYSSANVGKAEGTKSIRYTPSTVYNHSYIKVSTLPLTTTTARCKVSFMMDDSPGLPAAYKDLVAL
jgi:hypothetical protein